MSEAQPAAAHQAAQAGARTAGAECKEDGGVRTASGIAATEG